MADAHTRLQIFDPDQMTGFRPLLPQGALTSVSACERCAASPERASWARKSQLYISSEAVFDNDTSNTERRNDRLSNPVMAGLVPAIATRTELAKGAIPVSKHPMEMAGTSPAMTVFAAGGFRCEWGAETYAAFRSVVSTAKPNNASVLAVLQFVLAARLPVEAG